jgi:hypothetical protein
LFSASLPGQPFIDLPDFSPGTFEADAHQFTSFIGLRQKPSATLAGFSDAEISCSAATFVGVAALPISWL